MRALKYIGITVGAVIVLLSLFRVIAVTDISNYALGYRFNRISGEMHEYSRTGYVLNWPFVNSVYEIDLRPMQVCFNSSMRVLNCKLVQFDRKGLKDFLGLHGYNDYLVKHDLNGRATAGSLNDYLMNYAYSDNPSEYKFLRILSEIKSDGTGTKTVTVNEPLPTQSPPQPGAGVPAGK